MTRTLYLLSCSLLLSFSLAAPLPKGKDVAFKKAPWGNPIDPDKDCKFTFATGSLTITVPGKPHDYDPYESGLTNAPRLLQPVKGDFVAEVRARGQWQAAGEEEEHRRLAPFVTAGLLLVGTEKKQGPFRAAFGTCLLNKEQVAFAVVSEHFRELYWYGYDPELRPWARGAAKAAYLRMERRGGDVSCSISADGKAWQPLRRKLGPRDRPVTFAGDGLVGVAVFTTSTKSAKVTFDNFKLTPLKPKKD